MGFIFLLTFFLLGVGASFIPDKVFKLFLIIVIICSIISYLFFIKPETRDLLDNFTYDISYMV